MGGIYFFKTHEPYDFVPSYRTSKAYSLKCVLIFLTIFVISPVYHLTYYTLFHREVLKGYFFIKFSTFFFLSLRHSYFP